MTDDAPSDEDEDEDVDVDVDPDDSPADLYERAAEADDTATARVLLEAVLDRDPDHLGAHNALGIVAEEDGRFEDARDHYETALDVPDAPDVAVARTRYNYGRLLRDEFDALEPAAEQFRAAVAADPEFATAARAHVDARHQLADRHHDAGDTRAALDEYETAIAHHPDDAVMRYNAGVAREELGDVEGAREAYEAAAEAGHAGAHNNLGVLLWEAFDDPEGAREQYEAAIAADPDHASAHANYGRLLQESDAFDDPDRAAALFARATALDDDLAVVHRWYADLLWEAHDDPGWANRRYELALDADPDDPETHRRYAALRRTAFDDHETARDHLDRARDLDAKADGHVAAEADPDGRER